MGFQLPKFQLPKMPFALPTFGAQKMKAPESPAPGTPGLAPQAPQPGIPVSPAKSLQGSKPPILKIILIAIPVVAVTVAGLTVMSFRHQVNQLKGRLIDSEVRVEELSSKNEQFLSRLQRVEQERDEIDARFSSMRSKLGASIVELEEARANLETLRFRFEQVSQSKTTLEGRVAELVQNQEQRSQKLVTLKDERIELERTLVRMQERLNFMDRDYQQMALTLVKLERQPARSDYGVVSVAGPVEPSAPSRRVDGEWQRGATARGQGLTIELPPIFVGRGQAGMAMPVRGRLVEVNEPHRFVVVDKGSVDGVRVGMTFDIFRGSNTVIARATVVRVRPQLAACDIVRAQVTSPPQVGDTVVQSTQP